MPSPIDAEHLDAFVTFAEHLNFTRAARARRMSQPALHTQVHKLSLALGVELYVKRGNKLALTPDGQRVLGFGRDARERTRAFVAELSHREVRGPLVLCAGEGAYLYLLGEGVRRFVGAPTNGAGAELRLLVRDHEGTLEAVRTGEAHLGVASVDSPPEGLRAEPITEVGQVVIVPEGHPLAAKKVVRLRDLAGERLVVPPAGRPHRTMIAQALRGAGVRWHVGVEASGWELLVRFAEVGLGLAIVNAFCRVPPGMASRPMPELPSRAYFLFQRAEAAREGAVADLARSLRETANAWRGIRVKPRPDHG
jgi:DNA-binding transcriptional LysR family regulator